MRPHLQVCIRLLLLLHTLELLAKMVSLLLAGLRTRVVSKSVQQCRNSRAAASRYSHPPTDQTCAPERKRLQRTHLHAALQTRVLELVPDKRETEVHRDPRTHPPVLHDLNLLLQLRILATDGA